MPTVCTFSAIAIRIYFEDRGPPHFHAHCRQHAAEVEIATGRILQGGLPLHDHRLLEAWAFERRAALLANWARAEAHEPLAPIEPPEETDGADR